MAVRAEAKAGIVTSRPRDGFQWVVGIVASAVPALLLLIVLTLLQQAMPAIQHFGLAFVVNTDWNPVTENFGAAPAIFGTVFTAFLALAVALGATWWETTWRVILPSARAGIFGATILALGRALGETIAVTMVIGNQYVIPHTIFQPAYTLASVIANEFTEATGTLYPAALIELGLVLILVTFVVNMLALLLVQSSTRDARRAV